ncbi:MAG: hypothetical protein F4X02_15710 [Chloroflexi bacterium]|nr:hypothetical protein [Chloroflexota bacterium]
MFATTDGTKAVGTATAAQGTYQANIDATGTEAAQQTAAAVAPGTQTAEAEGTQTAEAEGTQTAEAEGTQTAEAEGTQTAVQQTADANATRAKQTQVQQTQAKQTADANATKEQETAEALGTINAATQNVLDARATGTEAALRQTAAVLQQTANAQATIAQATRNARGPVGDNGGGSSSRSRTPKPDPANQPIPTQDHSRLPAGAEIESDTDWIAFSEVSGAAISNPDVRAAALSAIDVWGPLGVDAEVCFAGYGSLLLLDTAYSPRRQVWLTSYLRPDGKVCAQVNRAGTVVLMPGAPSATLTPSPRPPGLPPPPTANPYLIRDNPATARALSDCMVTSIDLLNFRASPAGAIKSWYAGNSMALARTQNWFQVSYLGNIGWISAHFVTTTGDCS